VRFAALIAALVVCVLTIVAAMPSGGIVWIVIAVLAGALAAVGIHAEQRIRPEAVVVAVDRHAVNDAIFTWDTGMSAVWLSRFVPMRGSRQLLGSCNLGSMANAMPQALGRGDLASTQGQGRTGLGLRDRQADRDAGELPQLIARGGAVPSTRSGGRRRLPGSRRRPLGSRL
jgi:hypothetical protein